MKRFILSLLILISVSDLCALQLNDKFVKFRDFCLQCHEAYNKQSVDSLVECVLLFDKMQHSPNESWTKWSQLKPQIPQDSSLYKGHFLIDIDYMDDLVCKLSDDFIPIDKSTRIRGKGLYYANYLIPANSTLSFNFRGRGLMNFMIIPEDDTDIKLKIDHESCDHHYISEAGLQNGCLFDIWQAKPFPAPFTPIEIQVTNPSDHDIICTFVTD